MKFKVGKFKVGDTVKVTTDRFGPKQFGNIGIVIEMDRRAPLNIRVEFDRCRCPNYDSSTNSYCETDLELCELPPLLQPDFSLDEIAAAQEIMDQMG